MLTALSIRDFVIVDRLELEFEPGFTVLTGETGAGKSILVDALSLALGERGDSGMIRTGCERAEISAGFDISELPALRHWLEKQELSDGENCLLRRTLHADGRSRGFINGSPATMQQLREAGDFLVDIYSQHAHHSLLKAVNQRSLLDDFGGLSSLAEQVAGAHKAWRQLREKRAEMEQNAAAYAEELSELVSQARELTGLITTSEGWEALQQEHGRLANAAGLIEGSTLCRELLTEGEVAAQRQLHSTLQTLRQLMEYEPAMQEILEFLENAAIQIDEADRFLKKYLERIELDPQRLSEVEDQIQAMHAAARRHRVRPEELSDLLIRWMSRIDELKGLEQNEMLISQEETAFSTYRRLSEELSQGRVQAARSLSDGVSEEMQRLALAGGQFQVVLEPFEEGNSNGLEQVEFRVSGHSGTEPRPLSKVASGGELSRISLALRVVTASRGETPTMIFDEVDVGIGGAVAEIVGQLLKRLGSTRQVLVITHLPQVAAQGAHHLKVSKSKGEGSPLSWIEALSPSCRIEEIARMLGGVEIAATSRRHASEMLERQ